MITEVNVPTTYDKDIFCGLPVAKTIIVPNETPDMPETTPEGTDVTKDSKLSTGGIVGLIVSSIVALVASAAVLKIKLCNNNNDVDLSCSS